MDDDREIRCPCCGQMAIISEFRTACDDCYQDARDD